MVYHECDKCGELDALDCRKTEHGDYECLCISCAYEVQAQEKE